MTCKTPVGRGSSSFHRWITARRLRNVLALGLLVSAYGGAMLGAEPSGRDLRLSYRSPIDDTDQPYRLYLPASYNGQRPFPLVIAMHGTGGDEATLFDDERYAEGALKQAADKHNVIVASPLGRGITEYRGIGENDVLTVLEEVRRHYRIDTDRVYLTGHSMGGTGATYLALHHPDPFAAVAPLAAAYSFPWLARNAAHIPFLWIGGAEDREFYLRGVGHGVERMRKFGVKVNVELLPGEGHFGAVKEFDRIIAWLLQHKRDPHPREYVFEVDTPLHGRAYWTTVHEIAEPGKMALLRAAAVGSNRALFTAQNIGEFSFRPDPEVFDLSNKLEVSVNGNKVWEALLPRGTELHIQSGPTAWTSRIEKKRDYSLTSYRNHPVAQAPKALDMLGTEKLLANWITDAMREATGADIAIYNGYAYRGLPLPAGTVDVVDLVQCSRPFDQYLVTAKLSGRDLLAILDENIPDPKRDRKSRIDEPGASQLIQVSGASYVFDPRKPPGRRIVRSGLDETRVYSVAMEGQVVERETIRLAGRFKDLDYTSTGIAFTLALYGHAAKKGSIEARREGRVAEAP
jgi:predicted esterase